MTDERLNKHAAAEYLSRTVPVSPRTLDAWRAADKGPRSHKVAGRVFWFKGDLDDWPATQVGTTGKLAAAELVSSSRGGVR